MPLGPESKMRKAIITGLGGHVLSSDERAFLARERPLGIILFARNLETHEQIKTLVADARAAIGADKVLVLIDQEGGRVQRLRPPLGRTLPPAANYAALYESDPLGACEAAYLGARLLSEDLKALGINCNCAPVLDVPVAGAHDIIGDRAYGMEPKQVTRLGWAVVQGFIHGSVVPVIKHIPGHGRANADSHHALPVVDTARDELERTDFVPFGELKFSPAAMTAHVLYSAIDGKEPASTSATVTSEIIRSHMGFDGLLMSDDLSMKALGGSMKERAERVIAAGSDVALHCNGDMAEMIEAASGVPAFDENAADDPACMRFLVAIEVVNGVLAKPFDPEMAYRALTKACAVSVPTG